MPTAAQIASLLDSRRRPAQSALANAESLVSSDELRARVDRLATRLSVEPGAPVAVVGANVPGVVVALFAAWRAGAVAVPLSARLRRFELERTIADAEPAAVVAVASSKGPGIDAELEIVAKRTPTVAASVVVDELGEIVDETRSRASRRATPVPAELAALMYTSGTTGDPKGALVSHAQLLATGRHLAGLLGSSADQPCALVVPVTHAFGLGCLLASLTAEGLAVMVDGTTSLAPIARAVKRHDCDVLHGSPPLWAGVLRTQAELAVHTGFTAGSACPPEVLIELDQRGIRILNIYGMTEIGAASACTAQDPPEIRYHTVGRPLPSYEFRVALGGDDDQDGEIQVRGPLVSTGYHRRGWAADEVTSDGWFRTGDLGSLDAAGNLAIAGRAKEVVHVGGFNVFPAEVENFLLTNPKIAQAAVIGVPHPVLGEALKAFVVPADGAQLAPADIVRFARAGIAGYKIPYSVVLLDELPLLASGKPDRAQLARALAASEVGE